jgi:MFS family permease
MAPDSAASNHPFAPRICALAFLSYNITLGCMYGSYGVLLQTVEAKLGVTRELSSLGVPLANVGIAVAAPLAGVLAEKFSLRLLMLIGSAMSLIAYLILAVSSSIYVNLACYTLLIGPGLALTATVLPSALVARWYRVNRGRAFGLMSMPILQAAFPLLSTFLLQDFGLAGTYLMLAALTGLLMVLLSLVVDYPPDAEPRTQAPKTTGAVVGEELTVGQLLLNRPFWALSLGWAALSMAMTIVITHLVPMVRDWGYDLARAATLATSTNIGAMVGTILFGWLADKIGGARTLALLCLNSAVLWALLLTQPDFFVLLPLVTILGLHGGGMAASLAMAISQQFGPATFGRAVGLAHTVGLPLNFLGVPIAARIYTQTGSYAGAIAALSAFLVVTAIVVVTVSRANAAPVKAGA